MTSTKFLLILIELLVCVIHPVPGDLRFSWSITTVNESESTSAEYSFRMILSFLMVGRFYLLVRSSVLHLTVFNSKYQIIGKLNAVEFDYRYKAKTLMTLFPGRVLITVNIIYFLVSSWYLRLVES